MPSHVLAANRFAALRSDSEEEGEDGEAKPRRKVKKGIKRKAGSLDFASEDFLCHGSCLCVVLNHHTALALSGSDSTFEGYKLFGALKG